MRQHLRPHAPAIALIALVTLSGTSTATALLYTDQSAWLAANSGVVTITFEGLATASTPGNYSTSSGLTLNNVQFIGLTPPSNYYLYTEDPAGSSNYDWSSGDLLMGPNAAWGGGYLLANLPAPGIRSVGADLMTHTPYAASVLVTLSTGEQFTIATASKPTRTFAGFISNTPLTWIKFQPLNGFQMIDNFSYGSPAQDPPPVSEADDAETWMLGGAGLGSLLLARWLKFRAA